MSTVALLPNQQIKLKLPGEALEYTVKVMDAYGETAVLRVPEALVDLTELDEVELEFGYRNFYYQGPGRVKALYDHWWFLEPPLVERCRTLQRRAFVRIAFEDTMVAIRTSPLGEPIADPCPARLSNLSAGGCLARLPQDLEVGDHLLLVVTLPGLPVNPIISRVMRRDASGEGGTWYGIRFESADDRYQEELVHFVTTHIQEKLREGVDVTNLGRSE